ncbi:MAG: phosphoadenosine phosphosulfate reductase family protein [Clostridia bacterium]|nr:phosphoadenosine phosphosulfate reductase family protein [Clostridia bacterium]
MWNMKTNNEVQTLVYWCKHCNTPIIRTDEQDKKCPLCHKQIKKLTSDLRPVFPAEQALVELLTGESLMDASVWKGRIAYYVNGKPLKVSTKTMQDADIEYLKRKLKGAKYNYNNFNENIKKFVDANKEHLDIITNEAHHYILGESKVFNAEDVMVSFSGGKDSTVTADLVVNALKGNRIKHIFGDTTLEHDLTIEYVERLKRNKNIEVITARNNDNDFYKVAEQIGPPSRMSRWCCYMFKTGAVNRTMNDLFGNKHILTFYGIRKNESLTRSKYNRTEDKAEYKKISNQRVCSPIFYWNEFEIWLYILANKIDFNDAYKLGYSRVGCWCCPNASDNSELLAKIYLSKKYEKWHKFLVDFAKKIGKDEPENYIKVGAWKSRQGGQGLSEAKTVKLINQNCTVQENGKIYELIKPINNKFYELFIPFGKVINGNNEIKEKLVLDSRSGVPIISIQPLNDYKVKIVTLNIKGHHALHTNISHQIIKHNACKQCLKCEGVCNFNAIKIDKNGYSIDETKCKRCQMCVSSKYIPGGCLMCRYLRTRRDA